MTGVKGAALWALVTVGPLFGLVFWGWVATFAGPLGLSFGRAKGMLVPGWVAAWGTLFVVLFLVAMVWRLLRRKAPPEESADAPAPEVLDPEVPGSE